MCSYTTHALFKVGHVLEIKNDVPYLNGKKFDLNGKLHHFDDDHVLLLLYEN